MNRLALMVLKNICKIPGVYSKLCRYANHVEDYPEAERYAHIQHIVRLAVGAGNVDVQVHGTEQIPQEDGVLFYGNHQGMFDVLAFAATCDKPIGAVFKKELVGKTVTMTKMGKDHKFAPIVENGKPVVKKLTAADVDKFGKMMFDALYN